MASLLEASVMLFIFTTSLIFIPSLSCPQYQRQALLQFKSLVLSQNESLLGSASLESWDHEANSSDCCLWDRITCHPSSQQVISLNLSNLYHDDTTSLKSHILAPLFHIQSLTSLDISHNSIEGASPKDGFANLTNLSMLSLLGNKFSGPIPSSIFLLMNLSVLDLGLNAFSGDIPTDIENLSHLSSLDLSDNLLTGVIPSSIKNLVKLQSLVLDNNLLHGHIPSWLFDLKEMKNLRLGKNNLTWDNEVAIVPKCKLSSLSLSYCNVSGEFPSWLSNQTDLSSLDLSGNHLKGNFPNWLVQLSLENLILHDNKLGGTLPPRLFQSKRLSNLYLSRNEFSGQLPDNVGEATSLQSLMLSENNFSGMVPISVAYLHGLETMDLSGNRFSGKFPDFSSVSNVSFLYISSNKFSGEIPTIFGKRLMILEASQNEFTGQLPIKLANLTGLRYLDLHDNYITGKIPPLFSQMYDLQVLNLRNNFLQGYIPDDLSSNQNLRILDLSHNNLGGEIPYGLGNIVGMTEKGNPSSSSDGVFVNFPPGTFDSNIFPGLEINWKKSQQVLFRSSLEFNCFVDLSKNQLSGEIPVTFGYLTGLKSLNLSHNNLSGKIPTSFGGLKSIESLDLSHNDVSGEIPTTMAKLPQLNVLDLSNNKLSGPIPDGPQMDRLNDPRYYANNSGVCGLQIQVPCSDLSPPIPPKEAVEVTKETWFSWEFAGFGFPVGFFVTLVFMYGIGFFHARPGCWVR